MTAAPAGERRLLDVGGRAVSLANPAKVLYPASGFTKQDLADYYLAVASAILPHLAGRPVTLARFPDGVDAPGWYQTNCPGGRPPWLPIAEVRGARGQLLRYCLLEEPAALVWAASAAALELHPLLARAVAPDRADALVLDLDPVPPAGLGDCARLALALREALGAVGLAAVPKISGGRGLHLHVPLEGGERFERTKAFARALAADLARADPAGVTDRMPLAERTGKVLVDWRQNDPNRSMIAPWSMRAATVPLVAAPLAWEEVEAVAASGEARRLLVGPGQALERLARDGDPLAPGRVRAGRLPR